MSGLNYDKKQLPQVIGLGVLSAGLFAYFGLKMITPPPTQAAAAPASTITAAAPIAGAAKLATAAGALDPDVAALLGAAAPSDTMRDPFAAPSLIATTPPATTGPNAGNGSIPGLPALGQVRPLPIPGSPDAPAAWSVTGVICSDANPGESLAIFRSGDTRRYVRLGSMVDDDIRLIGIDRDGVTISRGNDHIRLALGTSAPPAEPTPGVSPEGQVFGQSDSALPPGTVLQNTPGATGDSPIPAGSAQSTMPADSLPNLPPLPTEAPKSGPPPGVVPQF